MEPGKKVKIIIADDHPVFRSGLNTLVRNMPFVSKVSEAANGNEVLQLLRSEMYHLVLMDVKMSPMGGIEATEIIHSRHPKTKVIALSMHEDKKIILEITVKGASGYLLKNASPHEIEDAIKDVLAGNVYYSKDVSRLLLGNHADSASDQAEEKIQEALKNEYLRDVAFLICHELSNKEIADVTFSTIRTVENNRKKLFELANAKNAVGLTKLLLSNHLLEDAQLEKKFAKAIKKINND